MIIESRPIISEVYTQNRQTQNDWHESKIISYNYWTYILIQSDCLPLNIRWQTIDEKK